MKSLAILVTVLLVTVLTRITCLSLDEIHSSSQTFKSVENNNKDKSLRTAIDTIRRRRQEYPIAQLYGPFSLPLKYDGLLQFNNNPNQQIVDNMFGQNRIDSQFSEESLNKDLLTNELALKLSQLLDENKDSDVGHRVYNTINRKKKRSTSKQNSYLSQTNAINSDRKHLKNVKNVKKHKTNSIKTLTKRKSGRRVLNDHFNVEENQLNVINKNKNFKSSPKPIKPKLKINRRVENKFKSKEIEKTIRKRRAELSVNTNRNSSTNDSKTPTKDLKITDKTVVSELNDILSDDNKTDKNEKNKIETKVEKKTPNLNSLENNIDSKHKAIRKMSKRNDPNIDRLTQNISDDNLNNDLSDDIIVYPNVEQTEERDENQLKTNNDLNEWLRKEFYENMAKTLATMRKKRSDDPFKDETDAINAIEESETVGDNIIAIDANDDNTQNMNSDEFKNFGQLSDDSDTDYVIAAIDDDIKDNIYANDVNDERDDNEEDDNREDDWNQLEDNRETVKTKRSVRSYFGDLEEDIESNDINSNRFTRVYDNLESIEDSLLNEALDLIRETAAKGSQNEVNSNKIGNRLDAAYHIEDMRTALDDLRNTFGKISLENDNEVQHNYETTPALITTDPIDIHKKDSLFDNSFKESDSKCSELEMVSSDCSSVAHLLPGDDLRYSFIEACNWHQICYMCGEIYGLLSSDCDAGFLESSRLSCAGSPSCEAFARLVLAPLRQSRVFYKSSVPQTCYRNQCIKDFLFDSQNNKN